jgi:hypothetical protein
LIDTSATFGAGRADLCIYVLMTTDTTSQKWLAQRRCSDEVNQADVLKIGTLYCWLTLAYKALSEMVHYHAKKLKKTWLEPQ